MVYRIAATLFLLQCGIHAFTASVPTDLARLGVPDPTIGVVVGIAAVAQIPAAIVAGPLVDQYGSFRILLFSFAAYLLGCAILLLTPKAGTTFLLAVAVARLCQGIGTGTGLPAALSMGPAVASRAGLAVTVALLISANNLGLVLVPALSLWALDYVSINGIAAVASIVLMSGLAIAMTFPSAVRMRRYGSGRRTTLKPTLKPIWMLPLSTALLFGIHWGVVVGYLPERAVHANVAIAPLFIADGITVLISRLPIGWLSNRVSPRVLVLNGIALTIVAVALSLAEPSEMGFIAVGLCTGLGAGLALTPILVLLARESGEDDRGSAFALYSATLATATVTGSVLLSPVVARFGYVGAAIVAIVGLAAALLLAIRLPKVPLFAAAVAKSALG